MGLEYLQLWADMEELFQPYDDAQRGRLVMAMMAYAYRGEEPEFTGVEKFIWPVLRQHINRCTQNVEAKKAAGSKGGKGGKSDKQAKADGSNVKQSEAEESKAKQTEADESESKQNAHTQYHTHYHNQDDVVVDARARESAPSSTPASETVEGIDGSDLSDTIKLNGEVDALLRQYGMRKANRGDILDDVDKYGLDNVKTSMALLHQYGINQNARKGLLDELAQHGLDKVKRVMQEAAESDTKGGLSLRFIRACLSNDGKPKPARSSPAPAKDQMMRYSAEERKATYSAAIVDFDEEV